jgi:hypothetical protein
MAGVVGPAEAQNVNWCFDFGNGQWNQSEWQMCQSPRFELPPGKWIQEKYHIVNDVPKKMTEKEMTGKRAPETFVSMLHKAKLKFVRN